MTDSAYCGGTKPTVTTRVPAASSASSAQQQPSTSRQPLAPPAAAGRTTTTTTAASQQQQQQQFRRLPATPSPFLPPGTSTPAWNARPPLLGSAGGMPPVPTFTSRKEVPASMLSLMLARSGDSTATARSKKAMYQADHTRSQSSITSGRSSSGTGTEATSTEPDTTQEDPRRLDLLDFIRQHLVRGKKGFNYRVWQLQQLAALAKDSFERQETLIETRTPVNICGDIHGQYSDLIRIFHACGAPHKERYLFLGDYVDRGRHSLEVICLLLACKVQYPAHIFLLRGNHELQHINRLYGFLDELQHRFDGESEMLWDLFNDVFSYMPLAATVGGRILCMHGGISPHLKSLDDIRNVQRPLQQVMSPGLVQDLLWADPKSGIKGFQRNEFRNCSVMFGEDALIDTLKRLRIDAIFRAHQCCQYGFTAFAGGRLYTVFSAARYHPEMCNWGAIIKVSAQLTVSRVLLKPIEFDGYVPPLVSTRRLAPPTPHRC